MANFVRTSPDIQKVLFVILHPGYIRFYNTVIANLIKKGCYVSVAFTHVHKKMGGLDGLPFDQGDLTIDCRALPMRNDRWRDFATHLRLIDDYLHYVTRDYDGAEHLRRRVERDLPPGLRWMTRLPTLPRPLVRGVQAVLRAIEDLIPPLPEAISVIEEHKPHVVVVSPLVERELMQIEVVKAARAAGVHSVLQVGSWDHLTTKRAITVKPEKILLWNDKQKDEAVRLHGVDPGDVVVTGAPVFDMWFGRKPLLTREQFLQRAGLDPNQPLVAYVGSSVQIIDGKTEVEFVRAWRQALREKLPERYADVNVIVRPHPLYYKHWTNPPEGVVVFPGAVETNPANKLDQADYFHTLHHADAVIGLNTSACVEASICGTPTLTVLTPGAHQMDTLHFRLLTPAQDGCLLVAETFDEHVAQLVDVLDHPEAQVPRVRGFVEQFVRPCGMDERAGVQLVRAITEIGWSPQPTPERRGALSNALTSVLAVLVGLGAGRDSAEAQRHAAALERKKRKAEARFTAEVKVRRSKFADGARARYIRPEWQSIPGAMEALAADNAAEDEDEEEEGLTA